MSAHYPSDVSEAERDAGFMPPMTIARNEIVIDAITLPGKWIEDRSVLVEPDSSGFNRVTVTFLAGTVDIADDALDRVQVNPPPVTLAPAIGSIACAVAGCECTTVVDGGERR